MKQLTPHPLGLRDLHGESPATSPRTGNTVIRLAVFLSLWMAATVCAADGAATGTPQPLPCERLGVLELKSVKEPSGICYHTTRKTLFVVDDSGTVCEFKPDGSVVHEKRVRSADFEGITHDPSSGLLYVAVEGAESILELDPASLDVKREFAIPRTFQGRTVMKKGGQGIEAIAFVPDRARAHGGTFFVANQSFDLRSEDDISALFEVEVPLKSGRAATNEVRILRCLKMDVMDLAALHYDADTDVLYAVSDATDRLMACSRAGHILRTWTLPGDNQEGITVTPDGVLYIAQDSGGVLKLRINWPLLEQRTSTRNRVP
jgi:hypothetical protein